MATGTLTSQTIAATYKSLLKVGEGANQELDGTPRVIEDGNGNDSKLFLSTDSVLISGTAKLDFNTDGSGEHIYSSTSNQLDIDATTEIEMATGTLDINATTTDISGTLAVGGTTTIGGVLTVSNGAVFNEASADVDFRIESNGNQHMFFLDGGNNFIGIGTAAPMVPMHVVAGTNITLSNATGYIASGGTDGEHIAMDRNSIQAKDDATTAGSLFLNELGGSVGIGTAAIGATLHIFRGESSVTPNGGADEFFLEDNGNAGITIGSATNGNGAIYFGDSGDAGIGRIIYDHSADQFFFYTDGASQMSIDDGGNVGIGTADPKSTLQIDAATGIHEVSGFSYFLNNIYRDGDDWRYTTTDTAYALEMHSSAGFNIFTAPSGSADATATLTNRFHIDNTGNVGIEAATPTAKLHIDQSSASGAVTVLKLDQGDVDDSFIDFVGTSAADQTKSLSTDTSVGALTGHIKIEINGSPFWLPYYAPN